MQPTKPSVTIENDTPDHIMARSGKLVGFSKTRVVWQFGFLPGSDMARAFDVSTDGFIWVIADYSGKILDQWGFGYAMDLPKRYKEILVTHLTNFTR